MLDPGDWRSLLVSVDLSYIADVVDAYGHRLIIEGRSGGEDRPGLVNYCHYYNRIMTQKNNKLRIVKRREDKGKEFIFLVISLTNLRTRSLYIFGCVEKNCECVELKG